MSWYYYIIICVLLMVVIGSLRSNLYKKSSYYQSTQKSLSQLDKGELGEYRIWEELEWYEKDGGKFLFNLYIPKPNEETTEIDVVLIHPKGFFVIESKNYSGWIFGNDKNRYWTQTLPMGRGRQSHKERFYSPLRQNGSHIRYLKRVLNETVPMWSLIVFSNECTFKGVSVSSEKRFRVIHLNELRSTVKQLIDETEEVLFSEEDIQWMYEELYPFTTEDEEVKIKHKS